MFALAVSSDGKTVYVGGYFENIGGQARDGIAAIDAETGIATNWNPRVSVDETPWVLAVSDTMVYAGGGNSFSITSQEGEMVEIRGLASIDAVTGIVNNYWQPDPSMTASLLLSGTTLYVGGRFTSIGGQPRNNIAALDSETGLATDWNPDADGDIYSIAMSGTTLFVGGTFSSFGGQSHNGFAQFEDVEDVTAPTVMISSITSDPTYISPIPVRVTFSEPVTEFDASDIHTTNATIDNFSSSGAAYVCELMPISYGLVTADIAAGVATDTSGNENTAATQFQRTYVPGSEGESEITEGESVEGEPIADEGEPVENEGEPNTIQDIADVLLMQFTQADTNGDGSLSFIEASAIVSSLTPQQFVELDENDDGFLSQEELSTDGDDPCGCCQSTSNTKNIFNRYLGDWLLVGLSLLVLLSLVGKQKH